MVDPSVDSEPVIPKHDKPPFRLGAKVLGLLFTQNPFYLLSVCFVLHGTSTWMNDSHESYEPLPLFLMICGYILMMSLTAVTVIRKAQLWEDARSILLLVPLLLVELSLTLDDPLITDPGNGRLMVWAAFLFSVGVVEMLLRGLKLRLPLLYRIPLHGLLALIMLYPLVIVPALHNPDSLLSASWRIFLFGPVSALALLSLIPAIRKGTSYINENVTPWKWPIYPWVVFGLLFVAVGVRGYTFSLSFDPVLEQSYLEAMQLDAAWGGYFLAPLLLALAFVLLELGKVPQSKSFQLIALMIPALACVLSLPKSVYSTPYEQFLQQFVSTAGSPLFLSLCGASLFYLIAWLRQTPFAEPAFYGTLLGFLLVGPETLHPLSAIQFQPLPLLIAGVLLLGKGISRRSSQRVFLGLLGVAMWVCCEFWSQWTSFGQIAISFHLLLVILLFTGLCFRDDFAKECLNFAGAGIGSAVVFLLVFSPDLPNWLPAGIRGMYVLGLAAICFAIAYPLRIPDYFFLGLAILLGMCLEYSRLGLAYLQQSISARGLESWLIGVGLLLLGIIVSAIKAGAFASWKALIPKPPPP